MLAYSVFSVLYKDKGEKLLQSKSLPGQSADRSLLGAVVNFCNLRSFKQFIQSKTIEWHGWCEGNLHTSS